METTNLLNLWKRAMLLSLAAILFVACDKEIVATKLLTFSIDPEYITSSSAEVVADVVEKSDMAHGEYGFCWNRDGDPNIYDDATLSLGTNPSVGQFSGTITGLTPGVIYCVRAYVMVGGEVCYGRDLVFETDYSLNIFYQESFDDNSNGWYTTSDEYGTYEVVDGSYSMSYNREGYFRWVSNEISGLESFANNQSCAIQVSLAGTAASTSTAEIGFVWNSDDDGFSFCVIGDDNGSATLYFGKYSSSDGFSIYESMNGDGYVSHTGSAFGAVVKLEVYNSQSQIRIYLNGEYAYTMNEKLSEEKVGFYLSNAVALADDLFVFELNKKDEFSFDNAHQVLLKKLAK